MWNPDLYDRTHAFVWQQGAALLELLAPKPGEKVLDLGCGTGHLTAQIAASGAEVLGVDRSEEMLAAARRSYPQIAWECRDARDLGALGPFDAVFSNAALHWVVEAERAAGEISRVLKPGGRFVAELGGRGNVRGIVDAVERALEELEFERPPFPWFFPSLGEYAALLEACGMEVNWGALFDRPTPLEGSEGLHEWVRMFGGAYLRCVPADRQEEFLARVEACADPKLRHDGRWVADYRRLRVVATRG